MRKIIWVIFFLITACSPSTAAPSTELSTALIETTAPPTQLEQPTSNTETALPPPTPTLLDTQGVAVEGNTCIVQDEHTGMFLVSISRLREPLTLFNNVRYVTCYMALPSDPSNFRWMVTTPPIDVYFEMVLVGKLDGSEIPAINLKSTTKTDIPFVISADWIEPENLSDTIGLIYSNITKVAMLISRREITFASEIYYIPDNLLR